MVPHKYEEPMRMVARAAFSTTGCVVPTAYRGVSYTQAYHIWPSICGGSWLWRKNPLACPPVTTPSTGCSDLNWSSYLSLSRDVITNGSDAFMLLLVLVVVVLVLVDDNNTHTRDIRSTFYAFGSK